MGAISAPLLAATSSALVAFVLTSETIRWANLALFLLMGATLSFVATVQLTFWAKRFVVTPSEIAEWWPERDEHRDPELEWEQRFHMERFGVWASRARWSYNSGILALLAALPVMLVPKVPFARVSDVRVAAVALAMVGFFLEVAWIVTASRWPRALDPFERDD
jgi:hypothetical protein